MSEPDLTGSLEEKYKVAEEIMAKRPVPPAPEAKMPPGMVPCACGKKLIPVEEVIMIRTPLVPAARDTICKECRAMVRTHALVVCLTCRDVVSRIPPHRDKHGFVFEKGAVYHTDQCPNCKPGIQTSKLLEKYFFDQDNKRK